jgi:hypothetical protein
MKDIRPDLKERLSAIEADTKNLQDKLSVLGQKRLAIEVLLREEEARFSQTDQILFAGANDESGKYSTPLSRIILGKIRMNGGIATLAEIKQAAQDAAYDFGEKAPGRSIHFALVGMAQNGLVEAAENGVWKMKDGQTLNGVH